MNSRTVVAILLGIFWFLYPPKAYAECKQCKANQLAQNETTDIKGWDTDKTTWGKKKATPSDQPIKVKKKPGTTSSQTTTPAS